MTGENLVDLRVRVEPGGGVVAVLDGVLLVIPIVSAGQDDAVEALLAAATSLGVVRAVARVVADFDEARIPPFSLVVEGGDAPMFALVHGEVVLQAVGATDEVRLAGREARSWVDRTLPEQLHQLSVLPQDAEAAGSGDAFSDLRAGVVRGGGVRVTRRHPGTAPPPAPVQRPAPSERPDVSPPSEPLVSFGAGASKPVGDQVEDGVEVEVDMEEAVEEGVEGGQVTAAEPVEQAEPPARDDDPADEPVPVLPANGSAYPGRRSAPEWASSSSADPASGSVPSALPPPPPLPPIPPPQPPPAPPAATPSQTPPFPTQAIGAQPPSPAYGGLRPAPVPAAFDPFAQVAPRTAQDTLLHEPASGEQGLGRLVLQDGQRVLVDQDCVIGRNPEADPDVARGRAKGVVLPDVEQRISRVHARLILSNGTASIVDQGSVNGTWIEPPGTVGWVAVAPDVPAPLPIGTRIQVGDAVLSYASTVHA